MSGSLLRTCTRSTPRWQSNLCRTSSRVLRHEKRRLAEAQFGTASYEPIQRVLSTRRKHQGFRTRDSRPGQHHSRKEDYGRVAGKKTVKKERVVWHATEVPTVGGSLNISSIFLRDQCQCSQCVDPSSKQKSFSTTDIPHNIEGQVVTSDMVNCTISWANDIDGFGSDHVTTVSVAALLDAMSTPRPSPLRAIEWTNTNFETDCKDITYDEYMGSDRVLQRTLAQLRRYGLAFLTGVPESEESVSKIAERIGPIKNSLYGSTWDVRSVPQATNVAYTSKDLGFHMDLVPMTNPPHLQFLHCLRSSAKGGNSLFSDAWTAAQRLWRKDPQAFLTLVDVPVTFHYDHPETHLYYEAYKVFVVPFKNSGQARLTEFPDTVPIEHISWSPPFQGPFSAYQGAITKHPQHGLDMFGEQMAQWRDAAAKFNALIQQRVHERRMEPGECVIFTNTRVLHARTAFEVDDAGKERWLRGCYVEKDVLRSKERVLQHKLGSPGVWFV